MINLIKNNKKKVIFISLAIILVILITMLYPTFSEYVTSSVWDGVVSDSFDGGTGDLNDPYIINESGQFVYLIDLLNSEDNLDYFNKHYKITNNLNLNGYSIDGVKENTFSGILDGNGFSVYNFNLNSYETDDNIFYGLFHNMDNATIKNINFHNVNIINNIESTKPVYLSFLGYSANLSNINNVSFNDISINNTITSDTVIESLMLILDNGSNNLYNIILDGTLDDGTYIFNTYSDSAVSNIVYNNKGYLLINTTDTFTNIYSYTLDSDNNIVYDGNTTDLLNTLNTNQSLEWYIDDNCFKLRNVNYYNIFRAAIASSLLSTSYDTTIETHDSGISGTTLYINDLTTDYNYLKSLNYTEITDYSKLPGEESTGYYDDEYLVEAQITYDAADAFDSTLVGHVSPTENVNKYVYYKYYALERDSSGNLLTYNGSNYIKIELIDNPFTARPTGKGFNSWVVQNSDIKIVYDSENYTRYAIVPISDENTIAITFNADWEDANIQTGGTSSISSLDDGGMKALYTTSQTTREVTHTVSYDCNPTYNASYYLVNTNATFTRSRNNRTIPAGVFYSHTNAFNTTTTYTYSPSQFTNQSGSSYYYFSATKVNAGDSYDGSSTYYVMTLYSGTYDYRIVGTLTSTDNSDYITYESCEREVTETVTDTTYTSSLSANTNTTGLYYYVGTSHTGDDDLYYDSKGRSCASTNNTCSSGTYKLVQYNDTYTNSVGSSIGVAVSDGGTGIVDAGNYYVLVTRDLNILVNTSDNTSLANYMSSKPYTLTASYNGSTIPTNARLGASSETYYLNADMTIENIYINSSRGTTSSSTASSNYSISANSYNLKIGRNFRYYNSGTNDNTKILNGIQGIGSAYNGSANSPEENKIIVESGVYNYILASSANNGNTYYVHIKIILGSDYDRITSDNSKIKVYFNALSSVIDELNLTTNDKQIPSSYFIIKSGEYGKTTSGYSTDNAEGAYVGGRSTTHYANSIRMMKIEGGDINVINGGPCVEEDLTSNSTALYMTGGTVREIYGGAGTTTTYGNRLVSISGGKVVYSVFGGSDAYDSGSEGLLTGNTLVYIGGDAVIGDEDIVTAGTQLFNVTAGNVFGAGNGASGGTTAGIVTNSHVIINGGTINGSVYGGGNNGSVGTRTNASTTATIDLYSGTVKKSVYGAGESVGGGYTNATTSDNSSLLKDYYILYNEASTNHVETTVTVTDYDGAIISGPTTTSSDTTGQVPGNVYLPDESKTTTNTDCSLSVVGSSQKDPVTNTTETTDCIQIFNTTVDTIPTSYSGSVTNGSTIPAGSYYTNNTANPGNNTNFYYASSATTCNVGTSRFSTRYCYYWTPTQITEGTTYNSSQTYRIMYDYTNYSGTTYKRYKTDASDYLTDRCTTTTTTTVTTSIVCPYTSAIASTGSAYSSSTTYYVAQNNKFVDVTPELNIEKTNDYKHTVYINEKGTTVNGSVYGGSNKAGSLYGNVNINLYSGTCSGVYGGGCGVSGDSSAVKVLGNTNIKSSTTNNSSLNVTDLYGGSEVGQVNEHGATTIEIDGGTFTNVYGGGKGDENTDPETYGNINVTVKSGNITNLYGGNNLAGIPSANVTVDMTGGTIANAFGGGSSSSVNISNITLDGATCGKIYGGSNNSGTVKTSNVYIKSGTTNYVYGGNNVAGETKASNVTITGGTINNEAYGGGYSATTDTTYVKMSGGTIGSTTTNGALYGGGESAPITTSTTVEFTGGIVNGNIYGGSNITGNVPQTNVNASGGTVYNVYGGGNEADVDNTLVNLSGSTVTTGVYGGGANANINTKAVVNITGGTSPLVFGGSNAGGDVAETVITATGGTIGKIYGGNNLAGTTTTSNVTENGTEVTEIYGGGNNSATPTTNVTIKSSPNIISGVYGGGYSAGADETNVTVEGGSVSELYGGSNTSGDVTLSKVTIGTSSTVSTADSLETNVSFTKQSSDLEGYKYFYTVNVTLTNNSSSPINTYAGAVYLPDTELYTNGTQTSVIFSNSLYYFTQANASTGGINTIPANGTYSFSFVVKSNAEESALNPFYESFGTNDAGTDLTSNNTIFLGNVYGGNNAGGKTLVTNVTMNSGKANRIFGGGNNADINSSVVYMYNGETSDIYGGGNNAKTSVDTSLYIYGGVVKHNAYGGGNFGEVEGNSTVILKNATINGSAYAGGNGSTATVKGNTSITSAGNTVIGTESCTLASTCSLFGGGNAAYTGTVSSEKQSTVNVIGGTIYGNVYGGANTSVVYGSSLVNIGNSFSNPDLLPRNDIHIIGTVFGGGEANANASDEYDYKFISITDGISVNIDGTGYDSIKIDGSIFGSGNASSSNGTSTINIKNYGSTYSPIKTISIQRTDLLTLDNSSIELVGATDRTNAYKSTLFSLSRIKELDLTNNSTLYLQTGTNLLESFKSLTSTGDVATVTIDKDAKTMTRNVDNRLYAMDGNKAINISPAEDVNGTVNQYGEVTGMTFFGQYKSTSTGGVVVGYYNDASFDDEPEWNAVFTSGSYVLGAHKTNHDLEADGFYSNYVDEDTGLITLDYVGASPLDSNYYRWIIGELVQEYSLTLTASKYSTLGAVEYSFIDFTAANTSFQILGFDYSELAEGVSLVPKSDVKRIAESSTIADNQMSLSIEPSTTGWLTNGSTQFTSDDSNLISGTKSYQGDNTTNPPSLLFYLHHSKNLSSSGDMGSVKIIIMVVTKVDALTSDTKKIIVNVNLERAIYDTEFYEASITSGRKYELFASTTTNITTKSSFSAYFSSYIEGNAYKTGYHRALITSNVLPLNTKITMIDLETNKYYYHNITTTDVSNATTQLSTQNDVIYPLSMFEVMGAQNSGVYYDDASMNTEYYDSTSNISSEEFIFIVDFSDADITSDILNQRFVFEMLDSSGNTKMNVLANEYSNMVYNAYYSGEAEIKVSATSDKDTIYSGDSFIVDLNTSYSQTLDTGATVYDTQFSDSKMGVKITLINEDGTVMSGTTMLGLTYKIGSTTYYPSIDGVTRIKLSDKVGNIEEWITVNTGTSSIASGNYKLRFETFGSPDGIYYGLNTSSSYDLPIKIVNEIYGLDINANEKDTIIDGSTGLTLNEDDILTYNIDYNSGLTDPKIHLRLYRRKYDTTYDTNFELVDFQNYVYNVMALTDAENKEYLVVNNPNEEITLNLLLKDGLQTGTYKIEFILYDGTSRIGTIEKYIIIK